MLPVDFLAVRFPELFNRGVAVLRACATAGDARAQRMLDDITAVHGTASFRIGDRAPVVLTVQHGRLSSGGSPDGSAQVKAVVQLPEQGAGFVLGHADKATSSVQEDELAIGAAQMVSKRVEDALAGRPVTCAITLRGVPEYGLVEARVGLNVSDLPETLDFTAGVEFNDMEQVRRGELTMQDLFLEGKLKMEGDYSLALQVAMLLLTNPL